MLYFIMFVIFIALIVGPIVASKFMGKLPSIPLNLLQPTGLDNNDTSSHVTGSALNGLGAKGTGAAAASTSSSS